MSIPMNISDNSVTFFAKGRPWTMASGHRNFDEVKRRLHVLNDPSVTRYDGELDDLIGLVDIRPAITAASGGKLEFSGSDIVWNGERLHNVWVDKILAFKDKGEPFDPIFKALDDLMRNPTPEARERLPIFVEQSKLGFLPDGRICAFKGVRSDGYDIHTRTVLYEIGKTVSIERDKCELDPNVTCAAGLHLGAIDYIIKNGYGWSCDRKMMLCAFWPRNVVAVPTDYQGGKMRVCSLDVLSEVDKAYCDELLDSGRTVVRGYGQEVEVLDRTKDIQVGDMVDVRGSTVIKDGRYQVERLDIRTILVRHSPHDYKLKWGDTIVFRSWVNRSDVYPIKEEKPHAKIGDFIVYENDYDDWVVEVVDTNDDQVKIIHAEDRTSEWITRSSIERVITDPPRWLRTRAGDKVMIENHPWLKDGEFEVRSVDTSVIDFDDGDRVTVEYNAGENATTIPNDCIAAVIRDGVQIWPKDGNSEADEQPAWQIAQVGQFVRVEGSSSTIDDGVYQVVEIDPGNTWYRLGVRHDHDTWWVDNNSVKEIVATQASYLNTRVR